METVKVLVIEDEQNIRENIQEILEAKSFEVKTASNGKEGLALASEFHPNLILCDVMMPKMDGFKVLEFVRKTPIIQNTPFIFLTAKIDKSDVRQGMELGADDYLTKPFSAKDLIKAIETRLRKQEKVIAEYAKVKHELDTTVFSTYYHEFNTPLHGILSAINLLITAKDSLTDIQNLELLYSIYRSGMRLNHSLANLMLYEELKRAEVHTELISMYTSGNSTQMWQSKISSELKSLARDIYKRENDLEVNLSPAEIKLNPEYLQRMVLELADNAFKFSKNGSPVKISGKVLPDKYQFTFTDKGKGFSLESINDIQPFKQFGRKHIEQQGLGIGLFIVKTLTDFNQGELIIHSAPDAGCEVILELPLTNY